MTRQLSILAFAATLALSAPARAQDAIVEGPGHQLSEGTVLHPSAGLELGVISNVFYEATQQIVSPVARLLLDLAVANDEGKKPDPLAPDDAEASPDTVPPKLQFRGGLRLTREQYFSGRNSVSDQSDFGVGAHLRLAAFPQGTVAFRVHEDFNRYLRPTNFESSGDLDRDVNHLVLGMTYQPGERAMTAGLRYENTIDVVEGSSFANRLQHLIGLRADWQFLPITKFYFDGSLGFFGGLGSGDYKTGSMPLRLLVGGSSAITEMTTLRLHIGYGNGFYSAGPSFSNVLFGTEFGLRYSPVGRFTLAYQYDFTDSVNSNFYRDHLVLAKLDQQIGLVLLGGAVEGRLRGYRGISPEIGTGPPSRDDLILALRGTGQYHYRDWLAFTGELVASTDQTDYRYDQGPDVVNFDPSYSRLEVWLGSRAAF
jgi:hypothetical protein